MHIKHGWWLTIILLFMILPTAADAAGFDIAAGPSVTIGRRTTTAIFASVFGNSPSDHFWRFQPIGSVGWLDARNTRMDDLDHAVWVAGGGLRLDAGQHGFASEQLVGTSIRTDALSSRIEFATCAGWQSGHFIVMLRHISNGRLVGGGKNLGETMLLAGMRW